MNASKKRIDENISLQQQVLDSRVYFEGLRVDNIDGQLALFVVDGFIGNPNKLSARKVFFTNVHSICLARKDKELRSYINEADLVLPDGSGLKIAGKVLGHPIVENLNGTDFIPIVLARAELNGWSVYLFGARQNIVEKCHTRLQKDYPQLRIAGYHNGYVGDKGTLSIIEDINTKEPDILLVALGSPLQEKWIEHNAPNLKVGVCFAVGGLFDFLSGEVQRAPLWVRRIGAEAIYRFMQDPRSKWRRIVIEPQLFLARVLATRISRWGANSSITKTTQQVDRS